MLHRYSKLKRVLSLLDQSVPPLDDPKIVGEAFNVNTVLSLETVVG
jgi:hypothetical protein